MRKAVGICFHVVHLVLLVATALYDHPRSRPEAGIHGDCVAGDAISTPVAPHDLQGDFAEPVPGYGMPVWRPDANIHYAGFAVARSYVPPERSTLAGGSCVQRYIWLATGTRP